ncbi:hypothetical protein NC652_039426 [Populus alba x Populus x berolinensis]|nr:hypothetical protein NC652_039426 [Populus alba x Populus x berolinensis]
MDSMQIHLKAWPNQTHSSNTQANGVANLQPPKGLGQIPRVFKIITPFSYTFVLSESPHAMILIATRNTGSELSINTFLVLFNIKGPPRPKFPI